MSLNPVRVFLHSQASAYSPLINVQGRERGDLGVKSLTKHVLCLALRIKGSIMYRRSASLTPTDYRMNVPAPSVHEYFTMRCPFSYGFCSNELRQELLNKQQPPAFSIIPIHTRNCTFTGHFCMRGYLHLMHVFTGLTFSGHFHLLSFLGLYVHCTALRCISMHLQCEEMQLAVLFSTARQ